MAILRTLVCALAVLMLGETATLSAQSLLTLGEALAIIEATKDAAVAKDLRLSVAVVDGRGDLIALARMSGASPRTSDTAIGKAMVSAMTGRPSAAMIGRGNTPLYQKLNDDTGGRLRFFQGALPIVRGGYTVGAVGSSGASSQDDEDAVRVAIGRLGLD